MIIIAALTRKRVIGKDNKLLWTLPDDMKNFRNFTTGNTVVMGRKTFESIGKPLQNRHNIVITSSTASIPGVVCCKSLEEAIAKAKEYGKEIFIIGGASVYAQALPIADKMYLSFVKKDYEGDAYFPEFDENDWVVEKREDFPDFEFVAYSRKK
jgi:dihydrofolate reductase